MHELMPKIEEPPEQIENKCPKDGLPESTHRFSRGKRLSICNNGHDWIPEEVRAAKQRAQEAAQIVERRPHTFDPFTGKPFPVHPVKAKQVTSEE